MDSYKGTSARKVEEMILRHCIQIRDHAQYKNAMVVFYIEPNLSKIDANRVWDTIRRVPNFADRRFVIRSDHLGCVGRFTTHKTKGQWVDELRVHIGTMTTVEDCEFITNPAKKVSEVLATFREQLINFRRDVTPDNKDPALRRGPAKINITGKERGKCDDLVSAAAICLINMDLDIVQRPNAQLYARIRATGRNPSC